MLNSSTPERDSVTLSLRHAVTSLYLAAIVFCAIAPTLRWLEFSNSAEALNVATAQEIRRTGHWLVPTLQDKIRSTKPPLTAWITALCISDQTLADISSADAAVRAHGFANLSWETRWPALLAACVTLILTAELGRLIGGNAIGITSLFAAGSSLLFLRFARYTTTDVQLMLWVTATNVLLLHGLIKQRYWIGFIGAGIALGLAMMSKGPIGLLQSIVPIVIWRILTPSPGTPGEGGGEGSASDSPHPDPLPAYRARGWKWPAIVGLACFALVGLSWFVLVYLHDPMISEIWWREITRRGATDNPPDKWYTYFGFLPYVAPWIMFFVIGCVVALKRRGRLLLPILLLFVPILVMSLAKDRDIRYTLPLLPAAAILVAIGFRAFTVRITEIAHWIVLGLIAVGFPVAMLLVKPPWFEMELAIPSAVIGAAIVALGIKLQRQWKFALVVTSFALMLGLQSLFIVGYRTTRQGRAELRPLAEEIASKFPDADIYNAHPRGKRPPPELGVYLNRVLLWTDSPSTISPGDKPQILLMLQDNGQSEPTPPPGWQFVLKMQRDKDFWWAFMLPKK